MHLAIRLEGTINKENGEPMTQQDMETFMDDFIEFIESKNLQFGGVTKLVDADGESDGL